MRTNLLRTILVSCLLLACGDDDGPAADGATGGDSPPGTIDGPPGPDAPPGVDGGGGDPCTGVTPVAGTPALVLQPVANSLSAPVLATSPPGDPRLFIIEKDLPGNQGRIRIVKAGTLLPTPFLTISGLATGSEQGLLGLAFHPDYATNGRFFVNYTDNTGGDTHVAEYSVSAGDPDVANPTGQDVIVIDQPFSNHNGGMIAFGPDGMLYIGMGDGGSGGDPQGHGQNMDSLLGKMLRIDVTTLPYTIPATNPFVGVNGADEIWSSGLRNPWRFSFDRETGDVYIADVGQNQWEEIDFEPVNTPGRNYGWNIVEGNGHCFLGPGCNQTGMTNPVHEYDHSAGNCSVTGGYVYRGCLMPGHHGKYFYADYCVSDVKSFEIVGGATSNPQDWAGLSGGNISSFGEDYQGELYVVDLNGSVSKVVPAP